jgi:hypothetical protein
VEGINGHMGGGKRMRMGGKERRRLRAGICSRLRSPGIDSKESISRSRILGSLTVYKLGLWIPRNREQRGGLRSRGVITRKERKGRTLEERTKD